MKAYASESYYIGVYLCGKEPDISAAFNFYAMQATSLMKQYTCLLYTSDAADE